MALLSEGFGDSAIVEFTVTFTPIGGVSVVGGFRSLNVDITPFGIRNLWERLVQQLFAGMAYAISRTIGFMNLHLPKLMRMPCRSSVLGSFW
jgi:hypothetical protein